VYHRSRRLLKGVLDVMDACALKDYIITNNYIADVLNTLNCHDIKEYGKEIRAGLPSKHDNSAISIKKDSLKTKVYTATEGINGDIFTLTMNLKHISFAETLKFLHQVFNLPFTKYVKEDKIDCLDVFKRVKKDYCSQNQLKLYDQNILNNYINAPNLWFLREGIIPKVQNQFNIGFCPEQQRITIPHRYWSGDKNDYLGIMGRTIHENYDLLQIPKYLSLVRFFKSLNLYGLQENYQHIQEKGVVIVFEGEKSVLKMNSWNMPYGVAVGCHDISPIQQQILVGLDVEICIAFDEGIPLEFIKDYCKKLKPMRKVSYIFDKDQLLDKKMSPVDKKINTFNYLFKRRTYVN
jgi:DNA primase